MHTLRRWRWRRSARSRARRRNGPNTASISSADTWSSRSRRPASYSRMNTRSARSPPPLAFPPFACPSSPSSGASAHSRHAQGKGSMLISTAVTHVASAAASLHADALKSVAKGAMARRKCRSMTDRLPMLRGRGEGRPSSLSTSVPLGVCASPSALRSLLVFTSSDAAR